MAWYILTIIPPVFTRDYEFLVRDELETMGYESAVPVRTQFRVNAKGRKVPRQSPMVRGYCFAEFPLEHISGIKRIYGVRGILRFGGVIARLTPEEVIAVQSLSETIGGEPTGPRYKRGQQVRIRRGHMTTLNALIERIRTDGEYEAKVDMFGRSFSGIRVKEDDIEAV